MRRTLCRQRDAGEHLVGDAAAPLMHSFVEALLLLCNVSLIKFTIKRHRTDC